MKQSLWLGLLMAAALAQPAAAQTGKLAVQITAEADDPLGRQLVFLLRDEVGRSGTFVEVDSSHETGFEAQIVTLDPYSSGSSAGSMTVYSYVILAKNPNGWNYYLSSYVGTCVTPRTCAQTLFTKLGEQAEEMRQIARQLK